MPLATNSIKKSRLPQKSRFVHQLILMGYNPVLLPDAIPLELPTENVLPFPMGWENGADHRVSNDPTPRE